MPARPRLVYVVTHPVTAELLLRGQLAFMKKEGFDVTVVSSPGPELERVAAREGVDVVAVPMTRAISPALDAVALARMVATIRALRPDVVNASTPKGGLLGMMAARANGVPVRTYLLRGLRLETAKGPVRRVLAGAERATAACAHDVVCVSESLRVAATRGGFIPRDKAIVLGDGSSNGFDVGRFERTVERVAQGRERLRDLGVAPGARVITFVGRFVRDKGIGELLDAFPLVRAAHPTASLLIVGADIGGEATDADLARRARAMDGVFVTGTVRDLAPLYAATDVLAFPSHREGFPNVVLEAACAAVPTVGARATGTVDAVIDGVTGALVDRGDVAALAAALARYVAEPTLAAAHGSAAHRRAAEKLSSPRVWQTWRDFYLDRLRRQRR